MSRRLSYLLNLPLQEREDSFLLYGITSAIKLNDSKAAKEMEAFLDELE